MPIYKIAGSRTVKTGISVFITAWLCLLLHWPPVFAVITAVVTLEPTVADSIRKGVIRFPASAIGSAYAVVLIYWFGNSPLTYTLAAVLTIVTCFKLRLQAGLLVATITAIAMVEVIDENFFDAFFIRLGTTTIGLVVSTLVNMFVMPPNYSHDIETYLDQIRRKTGQVLMQTIEEIVNPVEKHAYFASLTLDEVNQKLIKTKKLIHFQMDEAHYHPLVSSNHNLLHKAKRHIQLLELIHYHAYNLNYTPLSTDNWTQQERSTILTAVQSLNTSLQTPENYQATTHDEQLKQLMAIYWVHNETMIKEQEHPTYFPPEMIIMYELLSIYTIIKRLYEVQPDKQEKTKRKSRPHFN